MTYEIVLDDRAILEERATGLVFDLVESPPGPISLGIALLNEALVDDLTLRPQKGAWAVRLSKRMEARDIRFRRYGNQRLEIALGQVELERWLVFFLKYYRDSSAEVDHLDVAGAWGNGADCELTVKVSLFVPPVSTAEARNRLGM